MELIADILLVAGALGAGMYCFVLARRLKRFTDLEKGVGGAVSVLSSQVEELKNSLESARTASDQSGSALQELTLRAEAVAQRLELMMASMHDIVPAEKDDPKLENEPEPEPEAGSSDIEVENTDESSPNTASNEEAEAEAEAENTSHEPEKETPVKAPEGVMFFRHARAQGGGAK